MFDWLIHLYLGAIANYTVLLSNPVHCYTVQLLRFFSFLLLFVFFLRLFIHCFSYSRMRRQSLEYNETNSPQLFEIYRAAASDAKIKSLPALFQASEDHPLLFAVGLFTPSIFLAPCVAGALRAEELRAALVHELIHLKRRDALFAWLLEVFYLSIPLLVILAFAMNFVYSGTNSQYAVYGCFAGLILFRLLLWDRILFLRELSCDDLAVGATGDPLVLAASLIQVWRLSRQNPRKSSLGLLAAQSLLPFPARGLEIRIRRLINYRRPAVKILTGKALRLLGWAMLCMSLLFLWSYHSGNPLNKLPLKENTFHDCRGAIRRG